MKKLIQNTIFNNMRTSTILFVFIILVCFSLSSKLRAEDNQNTSTNIFLRTSPIKDKITVKLTNSYNRRVYKFTQIDENSFRGESPLSLRFSNFRTEVNYGLLSCLEVGSYFGFSNMGNTSSFDIRSLKNNYLLNFGGQVNLHPISLFSTDNRSRWDIWFSYKLGVAKESRFFKKSFWENGFGFGLAFFPFKKENLGFNFEFNAGVTNLENRASLKLAPTSRFSVYLHHETKNILTAFNVRLHIFVLSKINYRRISGF